MSDPKTSPGSQEVNERLMFLELAPGVSRINAGTFFYAAFATIGLLTFVSTGTAQVLNAIGIPLDDQGSATSKLVIITEIVQVFVFGIAGIIADRIGRREVAAVGIAFMGLGYAL
jgi:MFS family permease